MDIALGRLQARTCSHAGILDHCKRALPDCFFILSALCVSMKTLQKPCVDWLASFLSGGHCLLPVLEYRSQPHDGTFGDDGLRDCNWIRVSPLDAGIQLPENMCVCVPEDSELQCGQEETGRARLSVTVASTLAHLLRSELSEASNSTVYELTYSWFHFSGIRQRWCSPVFIISKNQEKVRLPAS